PRRLCWGRPARDGLFSSTRALLRLVPIPLSAFISPLVVSYCLSQRNHVNSLTSRVRCAHLPNSLNQPRSRPHCLAPQRARTIRPPSTPERATSPPASSRSSLVLPDVKAACPKAAARTKSHAPKRIATARSAFDGHRLGRVALYKNGMPGAAR